MDEKKTVAFLESVSKAFYAGDFPALLRVFCMPLVAYTAAGVTVIRDEKEFKRLSEEYLAALQALDVVEVRRTILYHEEPVNNRMRVTVRHVDLNSKGVPVTGSTVRYFMVQNENGLAIEMLEYIEAALPISDIEKIIH